MPTRWLRSDSRKQMLRWRFAFRQLAGLLKAGHLWAREGGSADLREKLGYVRCSHSKGLRSPHGSRSEDVPAPGNQDGPLYPHTDQSLGSCPQEGARLSASQLSSAESLPEFQLPAAASNSLSSWGNEDLSPEARHGGHTSGSTRRAKICRKNIPDRRHECKLPEAEASLA